MDCIDIYFSLVQKIGHHPTTTELKAAEIGPLSPLADPKEMGFHRSVPECAECLFISNEALI